MPRGRAGIARLSRKFSVAKIPEHTSRHPSPAIPEFEHDDILPDASKLPNCAKLFHSIAHSARSRVNVIKLQERRKRG